MLLKSTFVDGKTDTKAWSMPSPLVHASVMENRRRWHRPCCARTLQTASSTSEWKSCDLFFDIFTIRCLDSTIYLHLTVATENMFQCCQTNLVVVHVRWEHNSFLSPRNSIQDAFATIHAYLQDLLKVLEKPCTILPVHFLFCHCEYMPGEVKLFTALTVCSPLYIPSSRYWGIEVVGIKTRTTSRKSNLTTLTLVYRPPIEGLFFLDNIRGVHVL